MMNQSRIHWILKTVLIGMIFTSSIPGVEAKSSSLNKVDSRLQTLAGIDSGVKIAPQSIDPSPLRDAFEPVYDGKRIRIELRLNSANSQTLAQLQAAGLKISSRYGNLVSGAILPDQLKTLAKLDIVSAVYPYIPPDTNAIEGEGVQALRANRVHRGKPAFDGKGIKVGIISDSFGRVSKATPVIQDIDGDGIDEIMGTDSQLSGDLPPIVELLKEVDYDGMSDEGRGMAELVYEMAPGADLAFHTAWGGVADFANGIIALATAGCQVIVDDVIYLNEPFYQDGEIAQAVNTVAEKYDVVYLSSAGNTGNKALAGFFNDFNPNENDKPYAKIPSGNDLHTWAFGDAHNPTPFLEIQIPPQGTLRAILEWENPYSGDEGVGASCDYDLYALSQSSFWLGTIVAYSDNYQGYPDYPTGNPIESISVINTSTDSAASCFLAINLHHGEPAPFKIIFYRSFKNGFINSGRNDDLNIIWGHSMSANCLSVAAVNVLELLSGGVAQGDPRRIDPAFYSSQGGLVPILYSATGEVLAEPEIRFKPDIASVDGTNTSFFYEDAGSDEDDYPNFFGTSAAAPHAAAIAAMMRQANPQLSAEKIRNAMRNAAVDIYKYGVDEYTGWGLLWADDAIKAVTDAFIPGNPEEEPEATPTPELPEIAPTPEITPTPTATSTPTPIPSPVEVALATNTVIVTDDPFSTEDLSNGVDYDRESERGLTVRWNIESADVTDCHIYVAVDRGAPQYLGRTGDANSTYFEWKAGQKSLNPLFANGPEFAHVYEFQVYAITQSGTPPFLGPYANAGMVELKPLVDEVKR